MRGDRYVDSSIRFKYHVIIILISNWRSMRLADALNYIVVRLIES